MNKINRKNFLINTDKLISKTIYPQISNQDIHEFKIGKSYFYAIKDNIALREAQEWLNDYFQKNIPLNNTATAFRKNYSYFHLFEPHRQNYHFLRLDIQSFFHSINIRDVEKDFEQYFEDEYIYINRRQSIIEAFINCVTYTIPVDSPNKQFAGQKVLPMGFITSPVISNIIFRKLDIIIQKIASRFNIKYTRYADDMLFSSDKKSAYIHSDSFIKEISIVVASMNFKLNKHKTLKSKHTVSLNGYTIQYSKFKTNGDESIINEFRISNKKIDIIKKLIHMKNIEKKSSKSVMNSLFNFKFNLSRFKHPVSDENILEKYYDDQIFNKYIGYRSYLLSIINFDNKYNCSHEDTIGKYKKIVSSLNNLIERHNKY